MLRPLLIGCSLSLAVAGSALAQDAANGEKVFKKCAACHVPNEAKNKVGPTLHGVFGRTAGTVEGFKYSEAMTEKGQGGLVWSAETIDAYIADPKGYIPKNKMAFPGSRNPRSART